MKLVIAGSRRLPKVDSVAYRIQKLLKTFEGDLIIRLRCGLWTAPGPLEHQISGLWLGERVRIEWCIPKPDERTPGRASVYVRDIDMVADADLVLLFFTPEEAVSGYSGTAHLLDKAIDANVTVEAYTIDEEGYSRWIGGYTREELTPPMRES